MNRRILHTILLLPVLLGLASCEGLLSPESSPSVSDDELTIVRVDPDAPPLSATEVSFWAVRGEERAVEIRYAAAGGYNGKCLRFVVPAESLLRDSEGRMISPGDSIRITVRVEDPNLYLFEFDPGGVRFNPAHPARLEIRYSWIAEDANGDGVVDERDRAIADGFGIWRQERRGEPWARIPSRRLYEIQEIHADITGFTRYAMAQDRAAVPESRPIGRFDPL